MNKILHWTFAFFIFTYALLCLSNNRADLDLWGYLAFGRLFWHSASFPFQDVFAYVPTRNPWVYHEWLTGVLYYPLYQNFGALGLQLLKYGLGLATLVLIYLTATCRGAQAVVAAILLVVVAALIKFSYLPVRAQVFTYFFFTLSLYALEKARLSGRWRILWPLPLIFIPWANLHGGFVAGLGLLGLYATGEFLARRPFWPYLAILFFSLPVTLINPYGLDYWVYLVRAITMDRSNITEWLPLFWLYKRSEIPFLFILFVFFLMFLTFFSIWRCRWREVTSIMALFTTLAMGLRHGRHITFFFLLWGAYLPVSLNELANFLQNHSVFHRLGRVPGLKTGLTAILLTLSLLFLATFVYREPLALKAPDSREAPLPFSYPVGAVNYIKENGLSGKLASIFDWGEYLLWELYPQCLVGFDGRYETVYPEEVEKKFFEFLTAGPKWREFLGTWPPDLILLRPQGKITDLVRADPDWQKIYEDKGCILFRRRAP